MPDIWPLNEQNPGIGIELYSINEFLVRILFPQGYLTTSAKIPRGWGEAGESKKKLIVYQSPASLLRRVKSIEVCYGWSIEPAEYTNDINTIMAFQENDIF